jgi:16S rRNA (uracil1498-N3)-methyltransferase
MHRFYVPQKITGDTTSISDVEQLHHLRNVLRLRISDEISVLDATGDEYLCTITGLEKHRAVMAVKIRKTTSPGRYKLAVACAIPKNSRMDDIIDKLTQLGVDTVFPLETERSILKLDEKKKVRVERWGKIARNAAEQSRRNVLPVIHDVTSLKDILDQFNNYDLKLIATLTGERKTLKDILIDAKPDRILVLIGPEGDFTPEEVERALSTGFTPISLGNTVLRVETAAIAVASYIKFALME